MVGRLLSEGEGGDVYFKYKQAERRGGENGSKETVH